MTTPVTTVPSAVSIHTGVVDRNMHWLPETLISDPQLLQTFLGAPLRGYPTRRDGFLQGVNDMKELGLKAADERAVFGGNAKRIFKLS